MSMLAEPKRKLKWSVDPRNSAWSKDESKFGQKMLERMGWSKGKGLGRAQQGSTDHIKVKVKNNHQGFGTTASSEDKWIAHQDDFNELLAQLNNHHGQNNSAEPPTSEEPKGFSLEEKSKTGKKRVHYMKFTKGKDLSSRSKTDLNCIFGKRGGSSNDPEKESNSSDSQGETEKNVPPAAFKLDTETITNTVKSTLTMQEYFAQRMAQLKKSRGQTESEEPSMETDEISGQSEEPILIPTDDSEEPKKKKKKKKKKSNTSDDDLEVVEENSTPIPVITVDDEDQQQESSGKKKKKKKRKMVESEEATNENCSSTSGVEQNSEELPPSKKKKKHKKQHGETELQNGHEPTEDQSVDSEAVGKKKKHLEEVDDEDEVEVVEKKSKKDKKKKRKHQE
ncbi:hypothetical protein CgunFtcFv8_007395 [Champsocephalus gunnari]|uniref:G-patch domain-containing protein n=1 Tax=Champsocephalus gunnari TaxID=52237 RepID=A0AAN8H5N3_CHAGU|nr:hypothetical protein CgunFtcFv8_007395 [Champsocephalus gunnari]